MIRDIDVSKLKHCKMCGGIITHNNKRDIISETGYSVCAEILAQLAHLAQNLAHGTGAKCIYTKQPIAQYAIYDLVY